MASSQEIETTLIVDHRLRLTNAGIDNHFIEGEDRGDDVTFPVISVGVQDLTPDIIDGAGQVPGFYRATMLLDCMTYVDDDPDGAAVRLLAKGVRKAFLLDDIVDLLNALTTFNTYYTAQVDVVTSDIEDKIRHLPISFTTRMRPSK